MRSAPALMILAAVLAFVALTAAVDHTSSYFTVTEIAQGSDSAWQRSPGYEASCKIFGTFGGASADLETRIDGADSTNPGTCTAAGTDVVCDVEVAALLGVAADTDFTGINLGRGDYRLEVTGGNSSTSLTLHCRKVKD